MNARTGAAARRESGEVERVRPTPETAAKCQIDAVSRLLADGRIGEEELRAADEIERVFTAVSAGLFARARPFDAIAGGGGGRGRPEMAAWLARAYRDHFKPWADRLDRLSVQEKYPRMKDITLASVIEGHGLRQIERAERLKNGTASRAIAAALELYATMAGWRSERRLSLGCTAGLGRMERLVQPALCAVCGPMDCRRLRKRPMELTRTFSSGAAKGGGHDQAVDS